MLHCFDMAGTGGTHSSGNRIRKEQTTVAEIESGPGPRTGPGPGPESGAENRCRKEQDLV
jgi:hypothetical protein